MTSPHLQCLAHHLVFLHQAVDPAHFFFFDGGSTVASSVVSVHPEALHVILPAAFTNASINSVCWDSVRNGSLRNHGSSAVENTIGESIFNAFNSNRAFNCSVNFFLMADKTLLSLLSDFDVSRNPNNKGKHHDNVE